jgi:hypothetical protein
MARGQAGAADAQRNLTNSIGADERTRQQGLEDKLVPGYTSLMNTGYFSPEEEHAAVTSEMGSTAAPFETAKFEAGNRAGATHNASDLTAQSDQLALEQGRAAGDTAAGLQKEKMAGQMAGAYGLGQLKSQDQQSMDAMYGLGPATLQARAAGKSGDELGMDWLKTFGVGSAPPGLGA